MITVLVLLKLIQPPVDPTVELLPEAMITIDWDGFSDVDTHLLYKGLHLSYVDKDIGIATLARDDVGITRRADGKLPRRHEITEIHELRDGTYKFAVRMYRLSKDATGPVDVNIRFETTRPYVDYYNSSITLTYHKQTIAVFTIEVEDGKIMSIGKNPEFKLHTGNFQ